jgi:hypothetical protein
MEKTSLAKRGRFSSNAICSLSDLLPVLLDTGGTQSGKAVLIDGELPGEELIDCQRVTAAGLLQREQPATDRGNDFSLAANDPSFGTGRGQIRDC